MPSERAPTAEDTGETGNDCGYASFAPTRYVLIRSGFIRADRHQHETWITSSPIAGMSNYAWTGTTFSRCAIAAIVTRRQAKTEHSVTHARCQRGRGLKSSGLLNGDRALLPNFYGREMKGGGY